MKSHLLKNHSALLRKSKAANPASRGIMDRIESYQSKGIITSRQAEIFRRTLNEKSFSPLYIQKIKKELDRHFEETSSTSDKTNLSTKTIPSQITGSEINSSEKSLPSPMASQAGASDVSTKTTSTTSQQWHSILHTSSGHSARQIGSSKHISWEDESTTTVPPSLKSDTTAPSVSLKESASTETDDMTVDTGSTLALTKVKSPVPDSNGKRSILDLSEMKISGYNKPFNEKETTQLFVEMCFYARLGFTQPPCCLNCTYRESVHDTAALLDCPRWLVWRHNANQLMHPCYLEDNIVIVQCHAARRLLAGETVEGYRWNVTESSLEKMEGDETE